MDLLFGMVQRILEQNVTLAQRMAAFDLREMAADNSAFRPQSPANLAEANDGEEARTESAEATSNDPVRSSEQEAGTLKRDQRGFAFEELL